MMKFIRGLYMMMVYAIGLPILLVSTLFIGIWSAIKLMVGGYGFKMEDLKGYLEAVWYGFKTGHRVNMHFVKYGNKPIVNYDEVLKDL